MTYGDKRTFKKIDLYANGEYLGSTTWARTCSEAVVRYLEACKKYGKDEQRKITARFSKTH